MHFFTKDDDKPPLPTPPPPLASAHTHPDKDIVRFVHCMTKLTYLRKNFYPLQ